MTTTEIVQLIGGFAVLTTAVGALISALRTNRKVNQSREDKKKEAAEAAQIIVDAAADQVAIIREEADKARRHLQEERVESEKWKTQCQMLEGKYNSLSLRVESAETCKTNLTEKIKMLEEEKRKLIKRIEILEDENARLKAERDKN